MDSKMQIVDMVKTFDGKIHPTTGQATKHLDMLYANIICPLSGKLAHIDSTKIGEYIDANLDKFLELARIKDDMEMDSENE